MKEDLFDDPFLEKRLIKIISSLLWGRKITPINQSEKKIIDKRKLIQEMDVKSDHQLIKILERGSDYIPIRTSLNFLMYGFKRNLFDLCVEVLEESVDQKLSLTVEDLAKILKEAETMPVSWAVNMRGDEIKSRNDFKIVPSSGLNLEAMENFK